MWQFRNSFRSYFSSVWHYMMFKKCRICPILGQIGPSLGSICYPGPVIVIVFWEPNWVTTNIRDAWFDCKVGQIGPKWDIWDFSDQITVHFGLVKWCENVLDLSHLGTIWTTLEINGPSLTSIYWSLVRCMIAQWNESVSTHNCCPGLLLFTGPWSTAILPWI